LTNYVETRTGRPPTVDKADLRRCLYVDTPLNDVQMRSFARGY
jgi:hypothetical protein